eukprot:maker-scaffold587_size153100-snap-gene-0.29 protein:Tk01031 transcript:maker-scaffold587_size153100-snap-gene-0.29-mRNA-1 annotation:"hypothetical protein DAPPUDRAFT_302649"
MAGVKAFDRNVKLRISTDKMSSDGAKGAGTDLMFTIDDTPPWYMSMLLGLQHYLTMFGSTVSIPFLICPALCMEEDDPGKGYIISTIFFISGIVTLLQSTFGVRLPIVQGGTFSFLVPTFAILSLEHNACPANFATEGWGSEYTADEKIEEWQRRMREVQGAIIVASIFQLLLGYTGIIGFMLHYITPLTIAPAVAMIGLALFPAASHLASKNWPISLLTIVTLTLFSQYLRNVDIPIPTRKGMSKFSMFKLFPVLLTILMVWGLCGILTASGALSEKSALRTDTKLNIVYNAAWVRLPYPFQWGWPTVTVAGVFGMLAGVIASAIESVGDYYACARLSGARPPPTHAINRGIGTEGLGCILAGMWGTGNGTTSYSENIGAIGVTKVGSRRVIQFGGLIMIFFGLFSKFGAFFVTIPEPIVGGIFCVMFGMITAVGLSTVQYVDLNSSRNLFVLGFSIFFGLMLPQWLDTQENLALTPWPQFDSIIFVLLKTSMFVSGALGFFLDNTIPGTREERGLVAWQEHLSAKPESSEEEHRCTYDFPIGMDLIRKFQIHFPSSNRAEPMAVVLESMVDMEFMSSNDSTLRVSLISSQFMGPNETVWAYAESPDIPRGIYWGSSVYLFLVGGFGLISNISVLTVFASHKKLHNPFNCILMNLIIAELLIAVIGIPIDLTASLMTGWRLGHFPCLATGFSMTLLAEPMAVVLESMVDMEFMSSNDSTLRVSLISSQFMGPNETVWAYAESPDIPRGIYWGSSVYLFLVGGFGLISNISVLTVFASHKKLHNPFNCILMNLIIAELLIAVIGIPIDLTASLMTGWRLGHFPCLATGFSMTLLGMVSIFTLTSLAIQRWLLVTRPGKFSVNNWTHARLILTLIWLLSLAVALPPLLGWSFYAPETSGLSCAPAWEDHSSIGYNWYMLSLGFFLPMSIIVFTSVCVIVNLKMNVANQASSSVIRRNAQKRENKVNRMVLFMISSFSVSWTPYAVMCIYRIIVGHTTPLMSAFPLLFAKSSICWNPIIYVLMNNQVADAQIRLSDGIPVISDRSTHEILSEILLLATKRIRSLRTP